MQGMKLRLPRYFYRLMEKGLTRHFQHSAITKNLFMYPEGDRSGMSKAKKFKNQH